MIDKTAEDALHETIGDILWGDPRPVTFAGAKAVNRLRLHDLPGRFALIEELIADNDGELSPELEAELNALEETLEAKVDLIGDLIDNAEAEAGSFEKKLKALEARKVAAKRRAESLKGYLYRTLTLLKRDKVQGREHTARIQKNSTPAIRWTRAMEDIPAPFRRVEYGVDGDAAKQAYRLGQLPGGFVAEVGSHLRLS